VRILLDHCVPRRFGQLLTTYEMGWASLSNGRLLAQSGAGFDVFLTVDQNIQFQQNLASLPLPVVILVASDNRLATLTPYAPAVLQALSGPMTRELIRVESSGRISRILPEELKD
jgi:hypothetical protein